MRPIIVIAFAVLLSGCSWDALGTSGPALYTKEGYEARRARNHIDCFHHRSDSDTCIERRENRPQENDEGRP